jgi:hypothetical protein
MYMDSIRIEPTILDQCMTKLFGGGPKITNNMYKDSYSSIGQLCKNMNEGFHLNNFLIPLTYKLCHLD